MDSVKTGPFDVRFRSDQESGLLRNANLKIGIPIPVIMPLTTTDRIFTQFAYDMSAFRKHNSDFSWTAIEYRNIKSKQNLTYLQTLEQFSRMAKSAITDWQINGTGLMCLAGND